MGVRRRQQGPESFQIPDEIARDTEVSAAISAHAAATDPHPIYLTQQEGDARYRPAGALTDTDIPAAIARDAEVSAAVASHVAAGDPHPQYLIERVLALLTQGMLGGGAGQEGSTAPFDANTWNPNFGQAHPSAVNVAAVGIGNAVGNSNLPTGSFPGLIMEIDPFLGTSYASFAKTQLFLYYPAYDMPYSLWIRQKAFSNSWYVWQQIAVDGAVPQLRVGQQGTTVKRLISKTFTIDPPAIVGQDVRSFSLSIPGALVGDFCQVAPTTADLWFTALWPFEYPATVSATGVVTLFLRNDWSGTLDLAPFQIRVLVMGF